MKETEKTQNIKNDEPKKEEFFEGKKEKKGKKERSLFSKIMNVVLWIILFAWMALVFTDFMKTRSEKEPIFCWWNEKTTNYNDGTVTECTGLGYKVINYNRTSFKAIEFGPFWITDRSAENK